MSKYRFFSKYYAEDKDIYDLLKGSGFSFPRLLKIARDRGIYLSETENRETVINYLSELSYGWPELTSLITEMETEEREDKLSFVRVDSVDPSRFEEALRTLQKARSEVHDEAYQINATKEGKITAHISYSEFNPNSTRLKQRTKRHIKIEAEIVDSQLRIRHHSNKRAAEIISTALDGLAPSPDRPLKRFRVSLSGFRNAALRTEFFEALMWKMDDFVFRDVKDIRVDKLSESSQIDLLEEDEDSGEDDAESEDDSAGEGAAKKKPRKRKKEAEFKTVVRRMAMSGQGLHASEQYKALVAQGFYITRAVWVAREKTGKLRDIQFSAEFSDTEAAEGFVYDVRWVWERDEDGEIKKDKSLLQSEDRFVYLPLLEKTALDALKTIEVKALKPQENKT